MHKAQSIVTYIQTAYKDQPIKVKRADSEFCKIHLKKPATSNAHYKIVPGTQMPASPVNRCVYVHVLIILSSFLVLCTSRPVPWVQEDIKKHLTTFLSQIEASESKNDFRVGYEAR